MFTWKSHPPFPTMKQHNLETGRVYAVGEGPFKDNVYPSITRVLKAKPKPFLDAWKKRVGEEEAERIVQRAQARGNPLHEAAEGYLRNERITKLTPIVKELWVSRLRPWLDENITAVYCLEQDVFSDMLGIGGRMDCLADVRGELAVVDFKNARRPKKDEWMTDYYIQGTFYACAVYERTGLKVRRVCIPVSSPEEFQPYETEPAKHFKELYNTIKTFYETYEPTVILNGAEPAKTFKTIQG